MRNQICALLHCAVEGAVAAGELQVAETPSISVERARREGHGDFATPLPLSLAKAARAKPRDIAATLLAHLPESPLVSEVEIAGPGFINFHLAPHAWQSVVKEVLEQRETYGRGNAGAGRRVQVEFVSANPTGPLHVGHGRGAAYGAAVANLLDTAGWDVQREYYVNDAGRQMAILALSVWLRYMEVLSETVPFPANGYRGGYIRDMAATLHAEHGDDLRVAADRLTVDLPADEADGGDKEAFVDALIERARSMLGDERWRTVFDAVRDAGVAEIRDDLAGFGVEFDRWFSEQSLADEGVIERAIARLEASGHMYEKDGARWFRSSEFGDEKDRVVVRDNGQATYFASDIAYHMQKFERGFERVIDVWGADHHGYVARVKGALAALDVNPDDFEALLVQFAILYRGGERVQMSTRSGSFVTLRELRDEVGRDAARFFYVMRRCEQHMDFDLDLAKSQSTDNPVYYVQYAHARIASVLRQLAERGFSQDGDTAHLDRLVESHEIDLMRTLTRWPEVLEAAAASSEPHQVAYYLRDLANDFHTYYNAHQFIVDDGSLRGARVALVLAAREVLRAGLALLGVSAPDAM